jgi:hypothetical protein
MFPTTLETTFLNPYPSDQRAGHAQLHRDINAVVIALQAKLGIDNSLDNTTIDYLVKSSLNPGHTHTKDKVGLGNVANALQLIASSNLSDLVDVTTAVANLGLTFAKGLALASQAEAEAGVDNTKIMTPLRTKQAIAAFATPIASDVEFLAGTIETKAVNPKQIKDVRIPFNPSPTIVSVNPSWGTTQYSTSVFFPKWGMMRVVMNVSEQNNNTGQPSAFLQSSPDNLNWTTQLSITCNYSTSTSANLDEIFFADPWMYYRVWAYGDWAFLRASASIRATPII